MKYAVIAGTPVDTRMGADMLRERGIEASVCPIANDPSEQTAFQIMDIDAKHSAMLKIINDLKSNGITDVLVYCNSLSASVDFDRISSELNINIVTPMQVYRRLSGNYRSLGLIAANNQGLAGIEREVMRCSPDAVVMGYASLKLVYDVEAGLPPEQIIEENGLEHIIKSFEIAGAEAVILGCTHFPYFKKELEALTELYIIDPSDCMYNMLTKNNVNI